MFDPSRVYICDEARKAYQTTNRKSLCLKMIKTKDGHDWEISCLKYPRISKLWHSLGRIFNRNTSYKYGHEITQQHWTAATRVRQQNIKAICARALQKAKKLGRGLKKLSDRGLEGKILIEAAWQEALLEDHPFVFYSDGLREEWRRDGRGGSIEDYAKSRKTPKDLRVKYLETKKQRAEHLGTFDNGRLSVGGQSFNSKFAKLKRDDIPIFVISADDELFVGKSTVCHFHHSSFLAGGAILGGGEILTNRQGQVTFLSNRSGHYFPGVKQSIAMLKFFQNNGVDLSKVQFEFYGEKGLELYDNALDFLQKYYK